MGMDMDMDMDMYMDMGMDMFPREQYSTIASVGVYFVLKHSKHRFLYKNIDIAATKITKH